MYIWTYFRRSSPTKLKLEASADAHDTDRANFAEVLKIYFKFPTIESNCNLEFIFKTAQNSKNLRLNGHTSFESQTRTILVWDSKLV